MRPDIDTLLAQISLLPDHWTEYLVGAVVITMVVYLEYRFRRDRLGYLEAAPLSPDQIPAEAADYFASNDETLRRLGFTAAGDYQTVHGRNPSFERFYSCPQGDVFIEVCVYRGARPGLLRRRLSRAGLHQRL